MIEKKGGDLGQRRSVFSFTILAKLKTAGSSQEKTIDGWNERVQRQENEGVSQEKIGSKSKSRMTLFEKPPNPFGSMAIHM